MFKYVVIRTYEAGLEFDNEEFRGILPAGTHWRFDPLGRVRIEVVDQRKPLLAHDKLDLIVKSGALEGLATVVDLKDYERGLVWIDGRFSHILPPGLHAYWTTQRAVRVEVVDARPVRFEHADLNLMAHQLLETHVIEPGQQAIWFRNGAYVETLPPGRYAFWKNVAPLKVQTVDVRETTLDVAGQEIMTADKVTLRLNVVVVARLTDVRLAASVADDAKQALYREAQLAVRAVVGGRELDQLLADKDAVATELEERVRRRAGGLGWEVLAIGIRDVILPGEMKELLNKVTEAKKAAEANFIARREETAAMRSQANTAKLLQDNPTLLRLRELETLEKVAANAELKVVLGDKGLVDKIVNVL
ncbi:peptidase [Planctomycetaceae bacterium SCGC AG-212-F19]|nr:peptidase [Planctomycetaceae bacterium SCGC AG-212-F19]